MPPLYRIIGLFAWLAIALPAHAAQPIITCEAVWVDPARDRPIPVRIRMPTGTGKIGAILYSHGLGGSLDAGAIWAEAWAEAGFAVINMQHAGSDSALFGRPDFRIGLGFQQLVARSRDVRFVLDEIERKTSEGVCELHRIDPMRIGMAGHSLGAQTVQAVVGQRLAFAVHPPLDDPRIRAAVGLSPSPPLVGSPEAAFAEIRVPFLSITGTEDAVPTVIPITALQRQEPFHLMPPGDKFLLVLQGGTHEMFAGQILRTTLNGAPPTHIRDMVIAATTAFWRAALDKDAAALFWLQNPQGFRARLPEGDLFEHR